MTQDSAAANQDKNQNASPNNEEQEEGRSTVLAALTANAAIAVTKFIAAALSGSSAMFVEGIHSVVDTTNQMFLLVGMKRAKKPADEEHPFGYGVEQYFWSFIVAVLIFALGAGLSIWEGVRALLHGEHSGGGAPWLSYIVLLIAFCFEGYSWSVAASEFRGQRRGNGIWSDLKELKNPSIFVVLCEDTGALLGILIAALGITLSWQLEHSFWDAAASILIGIVLGVVAVFLANEVRSLLVGEAAAPEIDEGVRRELADRDEVERVNEIRTMHMGPHDILLALSMDFKDDVPSQTIERIVTKAEKNIKAKFPDIKRVFLEVQSIEGHREMEQPG